MKIMIKEGKKSSHWNLVAENGKTLAHSEDYFNKKNAIRTAKKVSRRTGIPVFEMRTRIA